MSQKNLALFLEKKKSAVVAKWFDEVAASYAPDTSQFLKKQQDPFSNPVGMSFRDGLTGLFDQVVNGIDRKSVMPFLDPLIRIRAVQAFTPSQATAFIFSLKTVLRRHYGKEIYAHQLQEALVEIESRIDTLGLLAFDLFMECREKIYHLKATTERNTVYRAFERAGLIKEDPEN
ncbi:MAG: RsbRD N-terminal domain-containing protein [Desulfobacterales bacterium]|nr:RsbRD N-terminal domain-containing protein [Desulfobacterales bacterium]